MIINEINNAMNLSEVVCFKLKNQRISRLSTSAKVIIPYNHKSKWQRYSFVINSQMNRVTGSC
jgi:hypothetical protein